MNMTFDQYIANPMGIKNAVYSNREIYRKMYGEKLDKILVREVGKIKYKLYKKDDVYIAHLKIPSEPIKDFYYDVVIQFYTDKNELQLSRDLKDYYVKFYSNDPSFVYTFAHAMITNDMFIRDLVPRMSKEAVKRVAVEKNPKDEIGYVKSIYFAYLIMRSYSLFSKVNYESYAEKYNKKNLLKEIVHADEKIEARQKAAEELSKEKKKTKQKEKQNIDKNRGFSNTDNVKVTSGINNISNIKSTNKIGSNKNIKNTSKIKRF
ncbi:MAG: hypothetical protein ACRDD7_16685 [Peptostreptococcaceae bacterium]